MEGNVDVVLYATYTEVHSGNMTNSYSPIKVHLYEGEITEGLLERHDSIKHKDTYESI